MSLAPFPDKHAAAYAHGYEEARHLAMERGWSTGFIRAQVAEWLRARILLRCDHGYFEHISGVLDALADILISRGEGSTRA